jgi:hypothetical protein
MYKTRKNGLFYKVLVLNCFADKLEVAKNGGTVVFFCGTQRFQWFLW